MGASARRLLRLLFGVSEPVDRKTYALSGFALAALKYAGDWLLVRWQGGWLTPFDYLSPLLGSRLEDATIDGSAVLWMAIWTLPFVWIGVSMTVRRARDAGLSGWLGLLFFSPFINYLLMIGLCLAPSEAPPPPAAWRAPPSRSVIDRDLALAVFAGFATGTAILAVCASIGERYGYGLFLGCPFAIGFVTATTLSRRALRPAWLTQLSAQVPILMAGSALLIFALEGILCLAMAYPLAAVLAALGAFVGRGVARLGKRPLPAAMLALALTPGLAGFERIDRPPPLRAVRTAIAIDAMPEAVWRRVVAFPDLPPPEAWLFRAGIAYPMRAEIHGRGAGAIRHCVFSTGTFIEPITIWDEPSVLAFDVVAQPPSMEEWNPWHHVEPPHLSDGLRAERGEFRLEPLPGGGTRLIGTTWYRLHLFPQVYWGLWSDAIIHAIHRRVLEHIARQALAEPS